MLLSVAIIARDEERHIGAALASIGNLADEIVVLLDPRTRDRTAEICLQAGARVVESAFESFPAQRNRALAECQAEWVLFLDADERVTPNLQHEIRQLLQGQPSHVGYWIPRFNRYWGRALRGGGWYPDHQLRLLQCSQAQYDTTRLVHELVVLAGSEGQLSQHLEHINIESWAELREKQQRYAQAEAATLYRNGVRIKPQNYILQPLRAIWRRYITWGGYRDGLLGMLLALVLGWYEFKMYLALAKHGA